MAFVIQSYNRFDSWDRQHTLYKFEINENWYGVMEVEMKWGVPDLPVRIGKEGDISLVHVFESYDEAMEFVRYMKRLNK